MEAMYLPGVEGAEGGGPYGERIRAMKAQGVPIPQIWHLFGFKPDATVHLSRYTQQVMRGPSPLPAGQRELIAAFISRKNACLF